MRIYIKGGPWKNSEDEILKSAVMKYGKNQWDRIASLLPRKSAKQCKARWYEWLDPSIRKTDWTREEEEKLLHLVKIMPTQWRTIAPIVGRTPYQCIEHFEYLLDKYQQRDLDFDPSQDPRRLRPGEVDGHAEHKPALPDAVDMDEDEKEMISEAKARMANTMGKKARRRARERQLENQRRLATIKKRRELKAAGIYVIESRVRKKKRIKNQFRKINFLTEIPWHKSAPVGYHDVESEKRLGSVEVSPERNLKDIEGRIREMSEMKDRTVDKKRIEEKEKNDLPTVINKIRKFHGNTDNEEKRVRFNLPDPQINDDDLRALSKVGYVPEDDDSLHSKGMATNRLLSSYSTTPAPSGFMMKPNSSNSTPLPGGSQIRTPYVRDTLAEQMRQVQSLRNSQTPFMAGQTPTNPSEFDFLKKKKGRRGRTETQTKPGETPNPFKTQLSQRHSARQTPFRDEMGINPNLEEIPGFHDDEGHVKMSRSSRRKAERERMRKRREELRKRFQMNLPEPKSSEYLIKQVSSLDDDEDDGFMDRMEDEEDRMFQKVEKEKRWMESMMNRRSHVSRRVHNNNHIPIPHPPKKEENFFDVRNGFFEGKVQNMIDTEMNRVVREDNEFINKTKKRRKKKKRKKSTPGLTRSDYRGTYVMDFDEDELDEAKNLVEKEMKGNEVIWTDEEFGRVWNEVVDEEEEEEELFIPDDLIDDFENKRKEVEELEKRNEVLTHGYVKIFDGLRSKISSLSKEIEEDERKLESFMVLKEIEDFAVPKRIEEMKERIRVKKEKEKEFQEQYNDLISMDNE